MTLTLEFGLLFENFNFVKYFNTVSARALVFYMDTPNDKTVPLLPTFITL